MNDWSDGKLLARFAQSGDQTSFAELVRRHGPMVLRICARMSGNDLHAAEDAAQQVFLTMAARADVLRTRTSVAGWLYRAAWNVSARQRRERGVRANHERRAAACRASHDATDTLPFAVVTAELNAALERALGVLPESYRDALVLHHFGGYTVEQTAEMLEVTTGTAASWLSRGRAQLRERLQNLGLVVSIDTLSLWMALRTADATPAALAQLEYSVCAAQANTACGATAGTTASGAVAASAAGGATMLFGLSRPVIAAAVVLIISTTAASGTALVQSFYPSEQRTNVTASRPQQSGTKTELDLWGKPAFRSLNSSNAYAVPEPGSLLVCVAAGALFMPRRRRGRPPGRSL